MKSLSSSILLRHQPRIFSSQNKFSFPFRGEFSSPSSANISPFFISLCHNNNFLLCCSKLLFHLLLFLFSFLYRWLKINTRKLLCTFQRLLSRSTPPAPLLIHGELSDFHDGKLYSCVSLGRVALGAFKERIR